MPSLKPSAIEGPAYRAVRTMSSTLRKRHPNGKRDYYGIHRRGNAQCSVAGDGSVSAYSGGASDSAKTEAEVRALADQVIDQIIGKLLKTQRTAGGIDCARQATALDEAESIKKEAVHMGLPLCV